MAPPLRVRRRIILDVETPCYATTPDEHDGIVASLIMASLPTLWRVEGVSTHRQTTSSPWPLRDEPERDQPEGPQRPLEGA